MTTILKLLQGNSSSSKKTQQPGLIILEGPELRSYPGQTILGTTVSCPLKSEEAAAINRICDNLVHGNIHIPYLGCLKRSVKQDIEICGGWSTWLAESIHHRLLIILKENPISLSKSFDDAWILANVEAIEAISLDIEHPSISSTFASMVVFGILRLLWPKVVKILGFHEYGRLPGSWAATWLRLNEGAISEVNACMCLKRIGDRRGK